MKCSECNFWKRSLTHGSYCTCMGMRPCDHDRRDKRNEHRKKHNRHHRRWV